MFGFSRRKPVPAPEDAPQQTSPVPRVAVLANWAAAAWKEGCQIDELPDFQPLSVQTRNTVYEMVVVDGREGRVRVRGGRWFPAWTEATLAGCSLGGSFLKLRGIYAGFCLEIHVDGELVITSPVQRLALANLEFATH